MALTLKRSGANGCDWTYKNDVPTEPSVLWPPTPLPILTQAHFAQLSPGRLKDFLTTKFEPVDGKSAAVVFAEAAMREGLVGRLAQSGTGTSVSFRLDDNGYPNAVWFWFGGLTTAHIITPVHIQLAYSASE